MRQLAVTAQHFCCRPTPQVWRAAYIQTRSNNWGNHNMASWLTNVLGSAVVAMAVGLTACGGDDNGDGENNNDDGSGNEQPAPGEPSRNTSTGIDEACSLFPGASTQVNLTATASGAPLANDGTNYLVIAAETGLGWSGYFTYVSDGGNVVFSIDTTAVTLDLPAGSAQPPTPTFTITSGAGAVAASESVAAPLSCDQAKAAYRYELEAGTYTILLNPTAWYQFRMVATDVN